MGCDIHMYIEVTDLPTVEMAKNSLLEVSKGLQAHPLQYLDVVTQDWEVYRLNSEVFVQRNYELFAFLAGVRGVSPKGHAPRGLPDDVSPEVRTESNHWGVDGHSHSWLLVPTDITSQKLRLLGESHLPIALESIQADYPYRQIRLVFWFDN